MNQVNGSTHQKEKPRIEVGASIQGHKLGSSNSKSSKDLEQSKARYLKGIELYKEGKVSITSSGLYKVNGYLVDLRTPIECECPDFTNRHEACKHIFAAKQYDKHRGKVEVTKDSKPENSPQNTPENQLKGNREAFSQERVNTRVSLIDSAIEMLKTHGHPIEPEEVFFLASRLEKWALGG